MQDSVISNDNADATPSEQGSMDWKEFASTDSPGKFARVWLRQLLDQLPGVNSAVVMMLRSETGKLVAATHWPADRPVDLTLGGTVDVAADRNKAVVLPSIGGEQSQVCYPVRVDGQVVAMVALSLPCRPEGELELIMRTIRWNSSWLELFYHRRRDEHAEQENPHLVRLLNVSAAALEQPDFQGAALAAANELAMSLRCIRVTLGVIKKGFSEVVVVSGASDFSGKQQILQAVGRAMDEAVDQQASVTYPKLDPDTVLLNGAQQNLASLDPQTTHVVCSVPLPGNSEFLGAITLEWLQDEPLRESRLENLELIAAILGPLLEDKKLADRSWWQRAMDSLRDQMQALFGPHHYGRKAAVAIALLLVAFSTLYHGEYRVTADTYLENTTKQAVVAPVDGFVDSAAVRAGDKVSSGQVLYTLDDRELTLEKLRWSSEALQLERQMRDAVAGRQPAKVRVLEAQLEQAKAQVALAEEQLARLQPIAPFDGMVISGDLSQSLGAPVSRGEVLFEVTPLDAYRVILMVDERDIGDLAVGQTGQVVLRSGSEAGMQFVVDRVSPLAETWDGRNVFRVEAKLQSTPAYLRPGMAGIGKVDVGERRMIWIWTHRFTHWLRLLLWEWF